MKYTINGFSQRQAILMNIDLTDLTLLRWFVDFKDARKGGKPVMVSKIINEQQMYWVQYDALLDEFPILALKTTDSIYRRFKKLADRNILTHVTVKKGGTYSFYGIGDEYYKLVSDDANYNVGNLHSDTNPTGEKNFNNPTDTNPNPTDTNPNPTDTNPEQNILLLNPSTKSSISNSKGAPSVSFDKYINLFEKEICNLGKTTTSKFLKILENADLDFVESLIYYCASCEKESFAYFNSTYKNLEAKGIKTKEQLESSVKEFKQNMQNKKNAAIKAKDNKNTISVEDPEEFLNKNIIKTIDSEDINKLESLEVIKENIKNTSLLNIKANSNKVQLIARSFIEYNI
ncbi:MAG: DnaD domain protein [Sarcina sp.]